jgi:hypothetical protein
MEAQDIFCQTGEITLKCDPLLPCGYTTSDLSRYKILELGRNNTGDVYAIRPSPTSTITLDNITVIRGRDGIKPVPVLSYQYGYVSRSNLCQFWYNCYNHDPQVSAEVCQDYWDSPPECQLNQSSSLWIYFLIFLGFVAALIVIVVLIIIAYQGKIKTKYTGQLDPRLIPDQV